MNLVAVLRKPQGLSALIARRRADADLKPLLEADGSADSWPALHEIVEVPFSDIPTALYSRKQELFVAWDALRQAPRSQPEISLALQTVLRETVAAEIGPGDLLPLPLDTPKPIRATAAHPRAYRGTKYQPPKPKSDALEDLRPHLCSPVSLAALLQRLSADAPDLCALAEEAAWQFRLPSAFRTHFLPRVQSQGRAAANALLSLYWRLECETQPAILAAASCLLCIGNFASVLPWLEWATELPAPCRALFLDLLLETEAYACDLVALTPEDRQFLSETAQGDRAAVHVYCLFRALQHGVSFDYMAAGFRLEASEYLQKIDWAKIVPGAYYPEVAIERTCHFHWSASREYYGTVPRNIWQDCGRLAALGPFLERVDWEQYPPETSYQYSRFYRMFADYDGTPEEGARAWAVIERHAPLFDSLLQDTPPEYHAKLIKNLRDFWWVWENAEIFARCVAPIRCLLRRLCRPPFRLACNLDDCCADFLEFLDTEQIEQFLTAPDACFHRLEDACQRDNDARLCGFGTYTLARLRPQWLLDAFLLHPAKLFRVCKRLGSFPHALRDQIVRETALDATGIPKHRLLREHEAGLRRLPDAQGAHYQAEWRRQTMLRQLQELEAAALARMAAGFPISPVEDSVRHALQIQWDAFKNRPALRRFLKAYWNGNTDYLRTHPRTQDWLRRHPNLNFTLWQQGIAFAIESPRFGPLTITVEQDPLEALKLGTYVGSCLGLGGSFSYSAAAAVLDINKQVLYARRPDGSVLARQLVAISDDDQLVAFYVYPVGAGAEIQRYFSEYNRRFADALAVPLSCADIDRDDADIETIIAHRWWHDMEWAGKKQAA